MEEDIMSFYRLIPTDAREREVINMLTEQSDGSYKYTYQEIARKLAVKKSFVQDTAKRHNLERQGRRHSKQ